MRSRLLLDPEGGASPILDHLDDPALLRRRREPDPASRSDDDIFLTADEHGPAVGAGGDDVSGLKRGSAGRGGGAAAMLDLDGSGRFGHPPGGDLGEGAMAPEEQQDGKGAQEHGSDLRAGAACGSGPLP
jgi:hypothetical protein